MKHMAYGEIYFGDTEKSFENKKCKLKIFEHFADELVNGNMQFVIVENDYGYQKGDSVEFHVVTLLGDHPLNRKTYEITYVLSGYGLENGFVALGLREIDI